METADSGPYLVNGTLIDQLMTQQNISRAQLAKDVGVTSKSIKNYIRGKTRIRHENLVRMGRRLGVPWDTLKHESDPTVKPPTPTSNAPFRQIILTVGPNNMTEEEQQLAAERIIATLKPRIQRLLGYDLDIDAIFQFIILKGES